MTSALAGVLVVSLAAVTAACEAAPPTSAPASSVGRTGAPTAAATVNATTPGAPGPAASAPPPPPVVTSAWELVAVDCPVAVPDCEVLDASADGAVVLLRPAGAFDSLAVSVRGAVAPVASPEHEPGVPVFGRLGPDGARIVFDDGGRLWRHDIEDARITPLPDLGGAVAWYVFTSASRLAVLVAESDTPIRPTQALELDLNSLEIRPIATRTDAEIVFATALGVVLQVDASPRHDNSDVRLYVVAADGSESLLATLGAAGTVAVALDGFHVAASWDGTAWLASVVTGAKVAVAEGGEVVTFSPDGRLLAVRSGGGVGAYDLAGTIVSSHPDAERVAWHLKE